MWRLLSTRSRAVAMVAIPWLLSVSAVELGAAVFPLDIVAGVGDVVTAPPKRAPKVERSGRWVVYLADADIDGLEELWAASLFGGDPVKISDTMLPGDQILEFQISPDGSGMVAFLASYSSEPAQLYVTGVVGGGVYRRSHDLDPGGYVASFAFSPDGTWLLYTAQTDPGVVDLFGVTSFGIDTAQAYAFTSAAPSCDTVVDRYTASWPDILPGPFSVAFRVVYVCNSVPGLQSLHRAVITDTTAATVATGFSQTEVLDFQFSDPEILVYLIDPDGALAPQSAIVGWDDLTPFAADHHIGAAVAAGGTVTSFLTGKGFVVYRADSDLDEKYELYLTTPGVHGTPPTPVQLHNELFISSVADVYRRVGEWVVFVQLDDPINIVDQQLRSSSILAPGSSTLLATVPSPGIFERFEVVPDASYPALPPWDRVVFRADRDEVDRVELYSVPAGGGSLTRLNPTYSPVATTWDVHDFQIAPDASHVVYVFDTEHVMSGSLASQVRASPLTGGGSVGVGPILDLAVSDGFLHLAAPAALFSPLQNSWAVSVHDNETPAVRRITLSDHCLFCDSFVTLWRWGLSPVR